MQKTPILSTRDLGKAFFGFSAVQSVTIDIHEGGIHAIIGPNGAGKTTFFNLLTKFLTPSCGTLHYRGQDITRWSPQQIARAGIVRSFQISSIIPTESVLDNVRFALIRNTPYSHCFWRSKKVLDQFNGKAEQLLESVGLHDKSALPARDLPYGKKRALELATTLALEPQVMLLDEPTQGLGHEDIDSIAALIKKVSAGRTTVVVEHNMRVVSGISDRVTVFQRGAVIADGTYEAVSRDPRVQEAYLGSDIVEEMSA
ncbi:ABC transporter ATP-binding protein [Noviherbaspirillum denitrificans]|uniref:ABC transporter ATP-binding protein n=1 Tax=Noviherbaspirillum denitrificans TaxID=1968433 RepID=A0A254TB55_9BURK|nr:ABC transporter ATP-binding protein [Noviherbaspirillum denitrificans]OWW19886.1 ABC transporter ATP-binding protein [Noviherbaspirillum denitrificans]